MSLIHRNGPWRITGAVLGFGLIAVIWVPLAVGYVAKRLTEDPCPYRVSASGTIHGPDSPYRAMVPPSRCYPTRAAAEAALQQR